MTIKITGTGSYIPKVLKKNTDFLQHSFKNIDGSDFPNSIEKTIEKFKDITGIEERRYIDDNLNTSDIAFKAAENAIKNANLNPEELDYIIVATNYGDVKKGTNQSDMVPSIASRVKHKLRIKNPKCVCYDILFGCPGWIESVIQAQAFIKAGMARKCLVIGSEALSRVVDVHDRDSMIFSDGAGASIVEASEDDGGILAFESATHAYSEFDYIYFGKSNEADSDDSTRYIKMNGRKIYEFALINVPKAMKACLEKSNCDIKDLKKIFIHQANEKMDQAILKRFYKQYNTEVPEGIMPMSIKELGNSSVATVPTLLDMVIHKKLEGQNIEKGDIIMFASVGAGMNINAIIYKY
ncbi:3-oxoacyl-ACP synthase III family protein [Zunongwangia sp.]|uniref:3-oxoacyl-ACP synthase III family protein n=1 Tax=Zunongwangia sp. TaxID=1965325 RepID=UPI003AA941E7